jgi:hypothetical protein
VIDVGPLSAAVLARLQAGNTASSKLLVFHGQVGATDWQGTAVTLADGDGRAHPYAVVYPSPGMADRMPLANVADGLLWSAQITCAGGDVDRALRAVDRVRDRLDGIRLTVAGVQVGVMREPEFATAGPVREDRDVQPSRWYAALPWELYTIPT